MDSSLPSDFPRPRKKLPRRGAGKEPKKESLAVSRGGLTRYFHLAEGKKPPRRISFRAEITSPAYTQGLDESQLEMHPAGRGNRISPPKRPMAFQPSPRFPLWKTDIL